MVEKLSKTEILALLDQLKEWNVAENQFFFEKKLIFKDFNQAFSFRMQVVSRDRRK